MTTALPEAPEEHEMIWGETIARPAPRAVRTDAVRAEAQPAARGGDHDGATISVAEARALRDAERAQFESTDGVPPRRPSRGRILLSTGEVVELERPVVIGRRPKSTRTSGADLPTLVAVDSPSRTSRAATSRSVRRATTCSSPTSTRPTARCCARGQTRCACTRTSRRWS
jgi:hypothetical protein